MKLRIYTCNKRLPDCITALLPEWFISQSVTGRVTWMGTRCVFWSSFTNLEVHMTNRLVSFRCFIGSIAATH